MSTSGSLLTVRAGAQALAMLRDQGLSQEQVKIMPGASGGPKWLVLSGMDRALWGEFFRGRNEPLHLIGSSAGSWRFACAPQADPLAALERLEAAYIEQCYEGKPTPATVTATATAILDQVLGEAGARAVVEHPWLRTHIVTTRCGRLTAAERSLPQMLAFGLCALGNVISRRTLGWGLQRVIFHSAGDASPFLGLEDLPTLHVALAPQNVRPALLASGSIPLVLEGVRDIPGAERGVYRDGGIIDYHFDLDFRLEQGLVLYPHFYPHVVPGWFDKSLRWRRGGGERLRRMVLIAPSARFLAALPYRRIPDRSDFRQLDDTTRIRYWRKVAGLGRQLGEEFLELVASGRIGAAATPL
jgi:hypothetical protein